ncbi:hypothetical protein RFI_29791, partial [Reticulomyxa filosa]
LCGAKCKDCYFQCLLRQAHQWNGEHNCLGSHQCDQPCGRCKQNEAETKEDVLPCQLQSGHEMPHNCRDRNHTCGKDCSLKQYGHCYEKCGLEFGQSSEAACICNSIIHYCNQNCSLSECPNKCEIDYTKEHTRHECFEKRCTKRCEIPSCGIKCKHIHKQFFGLHLEATCDCNGGHFHDMDMKDEKKIESGMVPFHCCSERHQCPHECQEDGNCKVEYKRVVNETKIFKPKTAGAKPFEYELLISANGGKRQCSQVLPKYKRTHEGQHKCTMLVHTCLNTCRACGYYCIKRFKHMGAHTTVHGNMSNCTLIVEGNTSVKFNKQTKQITNPVTQIEKEVVENTVRVYTTGDTAEAEICDFFCEKMGQGHFHLIECNKQGDESCDVMETVGNETYYIRRHASPEECGGRKDLDKVTHKYY